MFVFGIPSGSCSSNGDKNAHFRCNQSDDSPSCINEIIKEKQQTSEKYKKLLKIFCCVRLWVSRTGQDNQLQLKQTRVNFKKNSNQTFQPTTNVCLNKDVNLWTITNCQLDNSEMTAKNLDYNVWTKADENWYVRMITKVINQTVKRVRIGKEVAVYLRKKRLRTEFIHLIGVTIWGDSPEI